MAEDNPDAKKEKPMTFARTYNLTTKIHTLVQLDVKLLWFRSKLASDSIGQQVSANFIWKIAAIYRKDCSLFRFQHRQTRRSSQSFYGWAIKHRKYCKRLSRSHLQIWRPNQIQRRKQQLILIFYDRNQNIPFHKDLEFHRKSPSTTSTRTPSF